MVLCIGEILADMISFSSENSYGYTRYAGGAPLNVACAIKTLGGSAGFYGKVGDDAIGRFLTQFVKEKNLDFAIVKTDGTRNTTLAFVDNDESGERYFTFYRKGTADYFLEVADIKENIKDFSIIHVGSLMLSEKEGRAFADEAVSVIKQNGKKFSFDVNFREDVFRDRESAIKIYSKYVEMADIVKLSEDEVGLFSNKASLKEQMCEIAKGGKLVVVTLGKKGSAYYYKGEYKTAPSIKVKPVDTTGAGDAFYGAFLYMLEKLGESNLTECLKYANVVGALTTESKGAIESVPTFERVLEHIKKL